MIKYSSFSGHPIAYTVSGQGTPLVFLHGFCEDSSIWSDFTNHFVNLSCQVILIDLPGFGNSATIPNISISQMAMAVQTVLDELQVQSCLMFGHSMGGYTALAYAELFPERLTGLGMIHSHPYADTEERKHNRLKSIDFIRNQGHTIFVKQLVPLFFTPAFAKDNRFLVETLTLKAANFDKEGIIEAQQAMAMRPDRSDILKNIACPVFFLIGSEDQIIPLDTSLQQTLLPNQAAVHVLDKVGHLGMLESPRMIQKMFWSFVEWCQTTNT